MSSASQPPLDTIASAFRGLQIHNGQLEDQNRDLLRQNMELQAEKRELAKKSKADRQRSKKTNATAPQANTTAPQANGQGDAQPTKDMNVFQCGKYFVCAGEIWVRPATLSLFSAPLEKPSMAHDDPKRYEIVTPELTLMGARSDLYHLVPERLHESMRSYILFQEQFRRGMKDGRSTFISSIRKQMPTLFGLGSDYFAVDNSERRRLPEVARYLKFDVDDPVYPDLPPVIFPDLRHDVKQMFRNEILIKALGVVLRGNGFMTGSRQGTPDTNAKLWGVDAVTAPMIASTATMLVHLLSPAPKFAERNTALDLYRIHQLFKQLLVAGKNNRHIKETIRIYQEAIFGANTATEHIPLEPQGESASSAASNVLRELWADTSVDLSAPPSPARSAPRSIPPKVASVESSDSESSDSESSDSDSKSSNPGSNSGSDESSSSSEDEDEAIVEPDEEVGGTDYEDVYINPVSAPTSTGSSRHADRAIRSAPSSVPAAPLPGPAHPPALPVPLPPSHASASAPLLDPALAIAPAHLAESEAIAEPAPDKGKKLRHSKQAATVAGANVTSRAPVAQSVVDDDIVIVDEPVKAGRKLRPRTGAVIEVAVNPEEPAKKPDTKEKKKKSKKTSKKAH